MTRSRLATALATLALLAAGCATTSADQTRISSLKGDLQSQKDSCATTTADGVTRFNALSKANQQLADKLKEEIKKGQVSINQLDDQLRLSVAQEVLFDSGSTELREAGVAVLDKVASAVKDVAGQFMTVEGHTDNMQIGPSIVAKYPTNWELSTARATTVVRYLQDQGIKPQGLAASGFGEYRPVATNETEEGRQLNRRIEVVLTAAITNASRATAPTASTR
jgi:chemotaxis protein MotB